MRYCEKDGDKVLNKVVLLALQQQQKQSRFY